jgi:hypothetical protein
MKIILKSVLIIALLCSFSRASHAHTANYYGCTIYLGNDPITSNQVDEKDPARTVFTDVFANFTLNSNNAVVPTVIVNGNLNIDPIFCNGTFDATTSLFQKEKDFLDDFTAGLAANPEKPDLSRILLYSITSQVLPNAQEQVLSQGQPMTPSSVNTVEAHLARFINVARNDYGLEVAAIVSADSYNQGTNNPVNTYQTTLDISLFEHTISQHHATGSDPCSNEPVFTTGKVSAYPPGYWDYFDTTNNLIFPVDTNGTLHPYDDLREGIWNVRVFQEKYPTLVASISSSFNNVDEFEASCGFDRIMIYNEFWKDTLDSINHTIPAFPSLDTSAKYDITQDWEVFKLALDYANCTTTQLEEGCAYKVDSWLGWFTSISPSGKSYFVQDGNGNFYDPLTSTINQNMALEVEQKSDEIYLVAYKNTPCRSYGSAGATFERTGEYVFQQMGLNSLTSLVIPTLKARNSGQSLNDFLSKRIANGDSFNGTMGKAESAYRSVYSAGSHPDKIENFAWFHRSAIESGNFFKSTGMEDIENNSINLYPNPVQNELRFDNMEELAGKAYAITDLSGRVVQQGVINGPISTSQLASGMFLFQLEGNQIEKFQKID